MAVLPASEPFPGGLIRAFDLLTASGAARQVLVWIDQSEIVVKDAATLAQPRNGLSRTAIADIQDVRLGAEPAGAVLNIQTDTSTLRFRGTTSVIDGFVNELAVFTSDIVRGRAPVPQGRLQRLVSRFASL